MANYFIGGRDSRTAARHARLEVRLPPRPGPDQPHAQPGRVWKSFPALSAGQGSREIACAFALLIILAPFRFLLFVRPHHHRNTA